MTGGCTYLEPEWDAPDNVRAVTSTRTGGFSQPPFESFNMGEHVGDRAADVARNRNHLAASLDLPSTPYWLRQVHGTDVVLLDSARAVPPASASPVQADGSIATMPGVVCAVMTADCMPLFLCNRAGTKVGLVHTGWRGLANGVIEQAVRCLNEPAEQILAWAGPTISRLHFEIGDEVRAQLGGDASAYAPSKNAHKCFADLYQLAGERLEQLGVGYYGFGRHCTYADHEQFFSHRRDRQSGRMASLIWFTE